MISQKSKFGYNQTTISGMLNEHPNMFILLRAVWNILQLNNMKVTYYCISQQSLFHYYFTDSDICSSSIHRIHYCTSRAIVITWKWQNVVLYIQCLSCVMITNIHTVLSRPRCKTYTMDSVKKREGGGGERERERERRKRKNERKKKHWPWKMMMTPGYINDPVSKKHCFNYL